MSAQEKVGFHICACPDAALLRLLVDDLVMAADVGKGVPVERHVFWGDEDLSPRFWEALTLQGFMPVLRVVIVRNAQNIPAEIWKQLSATLARPLAQALPLFCMEGPWDKGQPKIPAHISKLPVFTFAVEKGWFVQRPGLNEASLKRHVQQLCRKLDLVPESGAVEALAVALPMDATAVESEMNKLALHAGARAEQQNGEARLLREDAALVAHNPDFNIFELIHQLQNGQNAAAWRTVLREQARGEELIFPVLGLLQREARFCWQVLYGETGRMYPRDVDSRKSVASGLGVHGLVGLWDAIHSAELAIKSGRLSPAQALDALMGDLARIFAPRKR